MRASTCMECGFLSIQNDSFFTNVGAEGYIGKYNALESVNKLPSSICKFCAGMPCLLWALLKTC